MSSNQVYLAWDELGSAFSAFTRARALAALNVYIRFTPPNAGLKAPKQPGAKGVKTLKQRIAADLWRGAEQLRTVPQRRKDGTWGLGSVEGKTGYSGLTFAIVARGKTRRGRQKPPMSDPEQVLRTASHFAWKGHVVHRRADERGKVYFVTRPALARAVRQAQSHAGELLSGWRPAYLALGGKRLSNLGGSGHGGRGNVRFVDNPRGGAWEVTCSNETIPASLQASAFRRWGGYVESQLDRSQWGVEKTWKEARK